MLPTYRLTTGIEEGSETLFSDCLGAEEALGVQLEALPVSCGSSRLEFESENALLHFLLPFSPLPLSEFKSS